MRSIGCAIDCREGLNITTIYEIAEKIGTSASTVSRALRNSGYVRQDLKEKIVKEAMRLNYEPNLLAVGLLRKKSYSIGLILPDINNPYFPEIARGVEDIASSFNYNVILCNTDGVAEKESSYIKLMKSKQIDGVIFIAANEESTAPKKLQEAGIPIVIVDRMINIKTSCVTVDNIEGGFIATKHLLDAGHNRIAILTGPNNVSSSIHRFEGYKRALELNNKSFDPRLYFEGDYRKESGINKAKEIIDSPVKPSAVFACNDLMAIGLIEALAENGIEIPRDISIVGYDDTILATVCRPKLTTVSQPKYEMGSNACKLILEMINYPQVAVQNIKYTPQLIIRGSTQPIN